MLNLLSFETVMIDGDVLSLTPCIDGTPLTFLVYEFETASGSLIQLEDMAALFRPTGTTDHCCVILAEKVIIEE